MKTIQDESSTLPVVAGVKGLELVLNVRVGNQDITFLPKIDVVVETKQRALHMSRLIESVIIGYAQTQKSGEIENLGKDIMNYILSRNKLLGGNSNFISVKIEGKYIYGLSEPSTVIIHTQKSGKNLTNLVGVKLTCISACPCSLKESKNKFTHTQNVDITVMKKNGKISELIKVVESCITPTKTLLKRDEEVELISQAYKKSMFVEDIVRRLRKYVDYVRAISRESIHKHEAIAYCE